eukprot:CFRG6513T1
MMRVLRTCLTALYTLVVVVDASAVIELTDANFESLVASGSRFPKSNWLMIFYSPKSPHSLGMMNNLNRVSETLINEAKVAKINCSGSGNTICRRFKISSYPTVHFIEGKNVFSHRGQRTYNDLVQFVRMTHSTSAPKIFPKPYDLFTDIKNELWILFSQLPDEGQRMVKHAPFASTMTFFVGTMFGFVIAILMTIFCFNTSHSGRVPTPTKRQEISIEAETIKPETKKDNEPSIEDDFDKYVKVEETETVLAEQKKEL